MPIFLSFQAKNSTFSTRIILIVLKNRTLQPVIGIPKDKAYHSTVQSMYTNKIIKSHGFTCISSAVFYFYVKKMLQCHDNHLIPSLTRFDCTTCRKTMYDACNLRYIMWNLRLLGSYRTWFWVHSITCYIFKHGSRWYNARLTHYYLDYTLRSLILKRLRYMTRVTYVTYIGKFTSSDINCDTSIIRSKIMCSDFSNTNLNICLLHWYENETHFCEFPIVPK